MDSSPHPRSKSLAMSSPTTAHMKLLENLQMQMEKGWITKDEFKQHLSDCNERYKDAMLGPSSGSHTTLQVEDGSSSKRKRIRLEETEEIDAADIAERNTDTQNYLKKTCRTFIYLQKKDDPATTKLVSVHNCFECRDGTTKEMWARQTRTSKTYRCTLPECSTRDSFNMMTDRAQKINNHNKNKNHLIAVCNVIAVEPGWEVVKWEKKKYKELDEKHKLKRQVEEGKLPIP